MGIAPAAAVTHNPPTTATQALRRAAVRARLAPSVHNTQPWSFRIAGDTLEIIADSTRQLKTLDSTGRQMLISCGCALFNARASLAASGFQVKVRRFPNGARPNLVARLTVVSPETGPDVERARLASLDGAIEERRTNRRRFNADVVPQSVVAALIAAASSEGSQLVPVTREEDRLNLAIISQRADRQESADPAYRAELRAWTTSEPTRPDGVQADAVPRSGLVSHDDIPIRDFEADSDEALPAQTHSSLRQCLLILGSTEDGHHAWLRAGEALERILLELTNRGFVASPLTQAIELPSARAMLSNDLRLGMFPHVVLRVGHALPTPATRRRLLVDLLTELS
ncbi:hypothetical protein SAMN05892883_2908 [Jatrophihabitans sp. GAS493]|uniref:Acg family FMN-binding oxidoreductase n=1 Tax=Jatrophihabitans sp. GAS493 TaxID=1907575 RepID=UPI000BB7226C|nr:nitroreductase [Jatrophihabitans sp. GAS493]SOD73630.1 hypothetical protein SAMN05892883_2908 [Jatrophihabitans sp. GAS493]